MKTLTDAMKESASQTGPELGFTPPTDGTIYLVYVEGTLVHRGESYELAARMWDRLTYQQGPWTGGVAVQTFRNGYCVRDGWLLHVTETSVYLNPTFA